MYDITSVRGLKLNSLFQLNFHIDLEIKLRMGIVSFESILRYNDSCNWILVSQWPIISNSCPKFMRIIDEKLPNPSKTLRSEGISLFYS